MTVLTPASGSAPLQAIMLRYLAFVYCVAFLGAWHHNEGLIGDGGLEPVGDFLSRVAAHFGTSRDAMQAGLWGQWWSSPQCRDAFKAVPSVLWLAPSGALDTWLSAVAGAGVAMAVCVMLSGRANMVVMVALWALYMSIVAVGQTFYGFGWESQLLETGAIGVLLVYPMSLARPEGTPLVPRLLYRWLLFRVMFGSGMIKLRGDPCWKDMSCMRYHYQTQPIPNPLSALFHSTPPWFHRMEVWVNHLIEVVAPFFVVLPQPAAAVGGALQILFQLAIVASGNLSFLNWLTIVPALGCFNDGQVGRVLCCCWRRSTTAPTKDPLTDGAARPRRAGSAVVSLWCLRALHLACALLVAWLSMPIVENLLAADGQQAMNRSYDWLRLVNTYGNFGSITRQRREVLVEGRSALQPTEWRAYEFACKPGSTHRRPCFASPYHYRLDWLMWFAALQRIEQAPWLVHLALKLLQAHKDDAVRRRIEALGIEDPFAGLGNGHDHPVEIRMRIVDMEYHPHTSTHAVATMQDVARSVWTGNRTLSKPYWRRRGAGERYMGAMNEDQLSRTVAQFLRR